MVLAVSWIAAAALQPFWLTRQFPERLIAIGAILSILSIIHSGFLESRGKINEQRQCFGSRPGLSGTTAWDAVTGMAAAPDIAALAKQVRAGDRAILARAITLIESRRADHQHKAHRLVQELLPSSGAA